MKVDTKVTSLALHKSSETLKSAYALYDAITGAALSAADNDELISLFNRLCYCASKENHFIANDLHSEETGDLFDGFGRFWRCNSKLCSYCLSINAKRNRKRLLSVIFNDEKRNTNRYYFITLTLPNHNLSLTTIRELTHRAWTLFRKRAYFHNQILAGCKSEEFTFNKSRYNYHLHLLVHSKFLSFERIRREWTVCVKIAFDEAFEPFHISTKDGNLIAKIIPISSNEESLKKISKELCKYITKNDSWSKIPVSDLIAIAKVKRFSRMFEIFGNWRKHTILDKTCISDGEDENENKLIRRNEVDWRTYARIYTSEKYADRLNDEFHLAKKERYKFLRIKFPFAEFRTWDNEKISIE